MTTSNTSDSSSTLDFFAKNGVHYRARIIRPGDGCGSFDQDKGWWTTVKPGTLPTIQFFDLAHPHTPHGQFISAYYLETLLDRGERSGRGLLLDGGNPGWTVDGESLKKVLDWATADVARRLIPAQPGATPKLQP